MEFIFFFLQFMNNNSILEFSHGETFNLAWIILLYYENTKTRFWPLYTTNNTLSKLKYVQITTKKKQVYERTQSETWSDADSGSEYSQFFKV